MAGELTYAADLEESGLDIGDYLAILKRRRFALLFPALIIFLIALVAALVWPATYSSKATILIEEQEIPQDLVPSTVTSFAAQQIQVTQQRVMTMDNVNKLIDKFALYDQADPQKRLPKSELALMFRENVHLDLISADVIDPRSGRPGQATIAFSLAFEDHDPRAAQKVANELVSLYLNENLRTRSSQAAGASEFLQAEATSLNVDLVEREEKLAAFKTANEGALPELYQFNLGLVERSEREIADINLRIQLLERRVIELSSNMAQLSPSAPVIMATGEAVLSDADRLKAMQSEYRKKASIYNDNHPDLVRLKREIATLQARVGGGEDPAELAKELRQQQDNLAKLRASYTAEHPKVANAERIVAGLQQRLAAANAQPARPSQAVPDNPAYVLLNTQLMSAQAEIRSLQAKKIELTEKSHKHEDLIRRAPQVEKEYQQLLRDYQATAAKYQEIKAKQRQADVARNLEQERKGQRFTLIEPPVMPFEPVSPNRPAIIVLGLILGLAAGAGLMALLEALDGSLYGEKAFTRVMGAAPLVLIPYLENSEDRQHGRRKLLLGLAAVLAVCIAAVLAVHVLYMPLDVLWYVLLRKIGLGE